MAVPQRRLTLEEFLRLPEERPALEFEEGEIIQKVSPKLRHSVLQLGTCDAINRAVAGERLALALPELRCTFAGRSYVPDVAVVRWERIPVDEQGEVLEDFFDPPDVAVEIISPEQSARSLTRKCAWYVDNGVAAALLVDPVDRSVVVFRPGQPPRTIRGDLRIDLDNLLPGFELTVAGLFATLKVR